jgi:hypothetical protein
VDGIGGIARVTVDKNIILFRRTTTANIYEKVSNVGATRQTAIITTSISITRLMDVNATRKVIGRSTDVRY